MAKRWFARGRILMLSDRADRLIEEVWHPDGSAEDLKALKEFVAALEAKVDELQFI